MDIQQDSHVEIVPGIKPQPANDAPISKSSFETDILPIFRARCSKCHNASSDLSNWLDIKVAQEKREDIYDRVWVDRDMPPKNNAAGLTDLERKVLADWAQGLEEPK